MPDFLTYYESIKEKKEKGKILSTIAIECGIGHVTASQKIWKLRKGKNTFTKLERERIAQILNIDVNELFPSEPASLKIISTI